MFLAKQAVIAQKSLEAIALKAERRLHRRKEDNRIETHLMEEHGIEHVSFIVPFAKELYLYICRFADSVTQVPRPRPFIQHLSSSNQTVCNLTNHHVALYGHLTGAKVQ